MGAKAGEELTADEEVHALLDFRPESGIDEDDLFA